MYDCLLQGLADRRVGDRSDCGLSAQRAIGRWIGMFGLGGVDVG